MNQPKHDLLREMRDRAKQLKQEMDILVVDIRSKALTLEDVDLSTLADAEETVDDLTVLTAQLSKKRAALFSLKVSIGLVEDMPEA